MLSTKKCALFFKSNFLKAPSCRRNINPHHTAWGTFRRNANFIAQINACIAFLPRNSCPQEVAAVDAGTYFRLNRHRWLARFAKGCARVFWTNGGGCLRGRRIGIINLTLRF